MTCIGWMRLHLCAALRIAALVTSFATPLVVRLATHLGIIDATEEERRMHEIPTPRIGGIAVFFGFSFALFAVLGFALSSPYALLPSMLHEASTKKSSCSPISSKPSINSSDCSSAVLLILGVGIWDDIMGMRPRNKLHRADSSSR